MESEIKEYRRSRRWKIGFFCLCLALGGLCVWLIYQFIFVEPNELFLILTIIGSVFVIGAFISNFTDRIVLGRDYIELTLYFRRKRFLFSEIDGIALEWNSTYLKAKDGKTMHISQDFEGWRELTEILKERQHR